MPHHVVVVLTIQPPASSDRSPLKSRSCVISIVASIKMAFDAASPLLTARPTIASAHNVMKRLVASPQDSCAIIKNTASADLLQLSEALCAGCNPLDLHYWQGYEALTAEPVEVQFCRQLADDLEGEAPAEVLAAWLPKVQTYIKKYLAMFDSSALPSKEDLFYLRVQVNQGNACIKYHDDFVTVRMVTTLCGEPTVVAPHSCVNWEFWHQTGGQLPMGSQDEDAARRSLIIEFNEHVCSRQNEVAPQQGDVLLMKGGALAGKQPCVHRAPYTADSCSRDGATPFRLLLALDYVSKEECLDFISMYTPCCDESHDDEEEEADDDDVEMS
eukprot:m.271972 g.271972  ORF g.271972 m.271972 type:complete len:329 (-) comp17673_c0_seq26:8-994(-)